MYRKRKRSIILERPTNSRWFNVYLPGNSTPCRLLSDFMCKVELQGCIVGGEPGPGEYAEYRLVPAHPNKYWAIHVANGASFTARVGRRIHFSDRMLKRLGLSPGRYVLEEV